MSTELNGGGGTGTQDGPGAVDAAALPRRSKCIYKYCRRLPKGQGNETLIITIMCITTIFYVFEIFYSLYFFLLLSRRFARVLRRLTQ